MDTMEDAFLTSPDMFSRPGGPLFRELPIERERVGYGDERWLVNDTWAVPHRWVCSLDIIHAGARGVGRGSGVLIGPRQVLTAAHNIYRSQDGKGPTSVYVIPARAGRTEPIGRFKAVAYSVPGSYLKDQVIGKVTQRRTHVATRFDVALVTLERDVSAVVRDRARDPRPFGHWGHRQHGHLTRLHGLDRAFLAGKPVIVAGYPGDRCGREPLDKRDECSDRDQSTVQFLGTGVARFDPRLPGLLLHTADTHEGQSGSPVWVRFNDGSRYLVGIHVGPGTKNVSTGLYTDNRAVHLSPGVVTWIRSLMSA